MDAVTNDEDERVWFKRMMLGEIQGDLPLIYHSGSHHQGGGEYKYFLTGSGASALMDYIELKEARESSRKAMYIAIGSLVITALLSVASIVVQICFK